MHGLSDEEAAYRLQWHGPNVLPGVERRGALLRLLAVSPSADLCPGGRGHVTYAIGEPVDASVIVGVVVANAAIGFVQEARAERALDALAAMMTSRRASFARRPSAASRHASSFPAMS